MKEEIFEKILADEMVLIDKPAGMTSFGVVARVRRVLSEYAGKKIKVGHTGTLDPFATGLMILMVGKGTKRCGEFLKKDKEYVAKLKLGFSSTTGDTEGKIVRDEGFLRALGFDDESLELGEKFLEFLKTSGFSREFLELDKEFLETLVAELQKKADGFLGEITQTVPRFSAVKIQGRRAYDLARKGISVEMPTRKVRIYEMEILGVSWGADGYESSGDLGSSGSSGSSEDLGSSESSESFESLEPGVLDVRDVEGDEMIVEFRAKVSSGTYIRTLGEDFAKALGTWGYLTELRRTEIGDFRVEEAMKLEELGVEE